MLPTTLDTFALTFISTVVFPLVQQQTALRFKQDHKGTSHCGLHFTNTITPHKSRLCRIQLIKYGIGVMRTLMCRYCTALYKYICSICEWLKQSWGRLKHNSLKGVVSLVVHIWMRTRWAIRNFVSVQVPSNEILCDHHLAFNTPGRRFLPRKHRNCL